MKIAVARSSLCSQRSIMTALALLSALGANASAQVISFATTNSVKAKGFENQGTVQVAVQLDAQYGSSVAVNYATVNNGSTAVMGTNYVGTSGTLVFQPGQTQASFGIQLLDKSWILPSMPMLF